MAVLNAKVPFAETMRVSVPLFCSVTDAPRAKPLTVPPIEYGRTPPPPPPVPPVTPLTPLQAASASEIRITEVKRENFRRHFMAIDCSFDTVLRKTAAVFHTLTAFPALLEKDFCSFRAWVEPWLFNERRLTTAVRHLLCRVLGLLQQRQLTWQGLCIHRHYL